MAWTNLIIGYLNYATLAGVATTTGEEDANFPATNVGVDQRGIVWKTVNGTLDANKWIQFDLGSAKQVDLFTVFDTNVEDQGINTAFSLAAGSTSPPTDATFYPSYRRLTAPGSTEHILQRHATSYIFSYTKRYWRMTYLEARVVETPYVTGKIFIGRAVEVARNYVHGISFASDDLSSKSYTPHGAANSKRRAARMRVSFEIPLNTRSDQDSIQTVVDTVGTHSPIVLIFDRDNAYGRRTFYGYFTEQPRYTHVRGDRFSYSFEFEEAL